MASQTVFKCNTCDLKFDNSQAQRTHMREPWHVYNLKRRMASLSPISAKTYAENVATTLSTPKEDSSSSTGEDELVENDNPEDKINAVALLITQCLFCTKHTESLEANLEHMSSEHGLYIPDTEHLSSIETFIEYLGTVVTEYNECLYCGIVKQSTSGIRRHMLDKGHCMINFQREPELLEFWEFSESEDRESEDEASKTSQVRKTGSEYTLPTGKVVGSKSKAREARLSVRRAALVSKDASDKILTEGSREEDPEANTSNEPVDSSTETQRESQGGTVAIRDAMGLIGVSNQQKRSLVTTHRKFQKQQEILRASKAWANEKEANKQKHYRPSGPMRPNG